MEKLTTFEVYFDTLELCKTSNYFRKK